jgi:hypothetical protein
MTGEEPTARHPGATAGTDFGLALASAVFEGIKAIPVARNVLSGLTGLYDIYPGYNTYQQCRAER